MKQVIFNGMPASKGIAIGKPFIYNPNNPMLDIVKKDLVIVKNEINEYKEAIELSKKELKKVLKLAKNKLDERNLMIFEAQLLFLDDDELHNNVISRITINKIQATDAFVKEIKSIEDRLIKSQNDYLKERIADIEDIKNRVLRRMTKEKLFSKIEPNSIVIARNLTPADTILFSNRNLMGFATDIGGTTSHVSIIARSIDIPAVVGLHDISLHVKPGDNIIVDGYKGKVIVNPDNNTIQEYEKQIIKIDKFEKALTELEKLPTETKDGKSITLSINLEFNKEIDYVLAHTSCEVGLYRTEHLFLEKGDFPSLYEQYRQYKMLADRFFPNKVTIRTFDIGGDKILPESQKESNPFLGWRGIRICLDKKDIFMNQLKAILRASAKKNLRIMLPMITSLEEIRETRKIIEEAKNDLKKRNLGFDDKIEIGIMAEVPSVIFIADEIAKEVDFFSLGTNDLIQYILAVARDSIIINEMYDKFHPSVIRALKQIVDSAKRNNIKISICGEMAGDPLAAILLIGMGVDELSVETTSYLRTKKRIRQISCDDAEATLGVVLKMATSAEIKLYLNERFKDFLQEY